MKWRLWLFTIILPGGLCSIPPIAQPAERTTNNPYEVAASTAAPGATPGASDTLPTDQALRNAQQGKNLSDEEAVMLVQSPNFSQEVQNNPQIATALAKRPYAASLFYNQSNFKEWSRQHPGEARTVMEAALKWDQMSQKEKEEFFRKHPSLKGEQQGTAQR